eukprot:m.117683 g.117683  ORF g.117683 m.117683 type:complete len:99 (-) comp17190_c0_seq1:328-624(-)
MFVRLHIFCLSIDCSMCFGLTTNAFKAERGFVATCALVHRFFFEQHAFLQLHIASSDDISRQNGGYKKFCSGYMTTGGNSTQCFTHTHTHTQIQVCTS